jgi:hypothetical protein
LEKLVLRFCIRPIEGALCAPGHDGYLRAFDLIRVSAPKGHTGHPDHERAGETFLRLLFLTRRPGLESQLLLSGSA